MTVASSRRPRSTCAAVIQVQIPNASTGPTARRTRTSAAPRRTPRRLQLRAAGRLDRGRRWRCGNTLTILRATGVPPRAVPSAPRAVGDAVDEALAVVGEEQRPVGGHQEVDR